MCSMSSIGNRGAQEPMIRVGLSSPRTEPSWCRGKVLTSATNPMYPGKRS